MEMHSWRHSHSDHMVDNPLSAVIQEWTLWDVMFCVILFGACSSSHQFSLPISHIFSPFLFVCLCLWLQVNARGGPREEREEQRKQNGGLHEDSAPKQHRKPERTPRYTEVRDSWVVYKFFLFFTKQMTLTYKIWMIIWMFMNELSKYYSHFASKTVVWMFKRQSYHKIQNKNVIRHSCTSLFGCYWPVAAVCCCLVRLYTWPVMEKYSSNLIFLTQKIKFLTTSDCCYFPKLESKSDRQRTLLLLNH